MGDYVAVECPRAYYYMEDGELIVSSHQYAGYKPFDIFCRDHNPNDLLDFVYLPAYMLALDESGKAVCLPGLRPEQGHYKQLVDAARTYANEDVAGLGMLQPAAVNFYEWALFTVEFAVQNAQTVMRGCTDLRSANSEEVHFIHSEELLKLYPDKTAKEREDLICRKHGAVFIIGIGGKLADGKEHDQRAPDYDDWSTPNEDGFEGLNGDLLIWYPVLGRSVELSSMGIRVDEETLRRQLAIQGKEERSTLYFHRRLLEGTLPQSIGGGIGQSRLCMILLHKGHIGETQASIWPTEMRCECRKAGMILI